MNDLYPIWLQIEDNFLKNAKQSHAKAYAHLAQVVSPLFAPT